LRGLRFLSRQSRDPREAIESRIEGQDSVDAVLLHYGQMYGIARGKTVVSEDDLFGPFNG
jgi:hypothetical protein